VRARLECDNPPVPRYEEAVPTEVIPPDERPPMVAVIRGPDKFVFPSEFRLTASCRIGSRAGENDIEIRDRRVSRVHAELKLCPEGVQVRDLESTNGTFYLGQRIGAIVLSLGSRFEVGGVPLVLEPDTDQLVGGAEYKDESYRGIVGRSHRMRALFAVLSRLESSLATILVEGESGVGKERVAQAIHEGSPASTGPFVAINCGAIPRDLVTSELFGHRRGAFTGAVDNRKGAFELAHGGTLFLDEIGELPLEMQPPLLRVLETGEIRPVGSEETKKVKVRLVAATNRDLATEATEGRFRQDLFYRIAVVRVQVPPLRARPEDIEPLALHFAHEAGLASLPPAVVEALKSRVWRGNARELRNAIQSFAAVGQVPAAPPDAVAMTPDAFYEGAVDPTRPYAEQKELVVGEMTRVYLRGVLAYTNGNQAAAARVAGLDRTHLGRLLAKHGMTVRREIR
jgi:transcriptional regulator with GAF, ATPase, and Fis domain